MATSSIQINVGSSGTYIATNSISEDAITKQIQRFALNNSSGTEQTAIQGLINDAAVTTDAQGTIHQYLRGLAKAFLALVTFITGKGPDSAVNAQAVTQVQVKTLKRVVGVLTTSGDNVVITSVGGKCLKVFAYALEGGGVVNTKMTDGGGGTQVTMLWNLSTNTIAVPASVQPPHYLFKTTAGNMLVLNDSAVAGVNYEISYWDDDGS